jgi:hypothetical protein
MLVLKSYSLVSDQLICKKFMLNGARLKELYWCVLGSAWAWASACWQALSWKGKKDKGPAHFGLGFADPATA